MKVLFYALLAGIASAYVVIPKTSVRRTTQLHESFGFDFAENSYENQIEQLKGEANYKQWVNRISDDNMLNRKVRYLDYLILPFKSTLAHTAFRSCSTTSSVVCASWIY
jgi:pyrroloquinoline quinone (PQQ) biosynthesis protein C